MDIRKYFWVTFCVALFTFSSATMAQDADMGMPEPPERGFKPIPVSPEKSARYTTDLMDSLLNLTDKQYDKLYKLNLKWAREDAENKMVPPRMGGRPEGAPDFGGAGEFGHGPQGNRPPEGFDRRPPHDFPPLDDMENIEEKRKKRDKKLKKLLTDEQYACWMEKRYLTIPEGMRKDKRKEW